LFLHHIHPVQKLYHFLKLKIVIAMRDYVRDRVITNFGRIERDSFYEPARRGGNYLRIKITFGVSFGVISCHTYYTEYSIMHRYTLKLLV